MTKISFQQKIKDLYKADIIANYVIVIVFLIGGAWLMIEIINGDLPANQSSKDNTKWLIPAIPLSVAFYALWRIPKSYTTVQIDSLKSIDAKINITEQYFSDVNIVWHFTEENYRSYTYRNKFFSRVDVRFYIDEKKVLFNAQKTSVRPLNGFIDFGLSSRATNRLKNYLQAHLKD